MLAVLVIEICAKKEAGVVLHYREQTYNVSFFCSFMQMASDDSIIQWHQISVGTSFTFVFMCFALNRPAVATNWLITSFSVFCHKSLGIYIFSPSEQ